MALSYQDWLEAQYGVLGSMLISPEVVPKTLSQISDSDFSGKCVAVYQAIRAIFSSGAPVDVVTVRDKLGSEYSGFLMQLMEITPTAANYQAYIDIAKKQSRIARIKEIGQQIADADSIEQIHELLERALYISSTRQGLQAVTFKDALKDFIDRHSSDKKPDYLSWPIREMNDQLFIEPGDFVIIGGKPSAGKTAFALQCAWDLSENKRIGFFSLETNSKKITDRQVSSICGIPMENLKRNLLNSSHWDSVIELGDRESNRKFEIIQASNVRVSDLHAFSIARQYDVIFVDYLQLLAASGNDFSSNDNDYARVTNLSIAMHQFSQSAGITVIGLSQLNRGDNGGKKSSPDMASLRASGQLEQDADSILLLYLEDETQPNGRRILKCAKNKEGERFRIMLDFDGKTQRFSKSKDYSAFKNGMAKINKERREAEKYSKMNQMEILPPETPVPKEFEA